MTTILEKNSLVCGITLSTFPDTNRITIHFVGAPDISTRTYKKTSDTQTGIKYLYNFV